jgi:hypothetical protein
MHLGFIVYVVVGDTIDICLMDTFVPNESDMCAKNIFLVVYP